MHEVVELAACLGVETGGRLVEEEQLGPADDADGDVEAAALPTGELARALVACGVSPTVSIRSSMFQGRRMRGVEYAA